MQLSNQTKIAILSAACLLGLTVVLKNILHVPAEILSRDIVLYIIIFSFFGIIFPSAEKKNCCKLIYWYLTILVVTLAIIGVHAL
jgi:hypothetical protein